MYFYHPGKNTCSDFAFPEIADDLCRNKCEPCVFLRDSLWVTHFYYREGEIMKRVGLFVFIICAFCTAFCFSGCDGEFENKVKENIEVFNVHDSAKINELIFGDSLEIAPEIQEFFTDENKTKYSVLDEIINKSTIKYLGRNEEYVNLEVIAPNMEGGFEDSEVLSSNDEKTIYEAIKSFAEKTDLKSFKIEIGYTDEDEEVILNYRDPQFINAITGGLQSEYQKIYDSMLSSYWEELK